MHWTQFTYTKKVCYLSLHSVPRVKRETRIQFLLGPVLLGPTFKGIGSFPAKMLILFDRQLIALQLPLEAFRQ